MRPNVTQIGNRIFHITSKSSQLFNSCCQITCKIAVHCSIDWAYFGFVNFTRNSRTCQKEFKLFNKLECALVEWLFIPLKQLHSISIPQLFCLGTIFSTLLILLSGSWWNTTSVGIVSFLHATLTSLTPRNGSVMNIFKLGIASVVDSLI